MDEERLREIEERAERATPGPWVRKKWPGDLTVVRQAEWTPCGEPDHDDCVVAQSIAPEGDGPHHTALVRAYHPTQIAHMDAEFIAHAREDVPALVAEVRRLREENGKLRVYRNYAVGTDAPGVKLPTGATKIRLYLDGKLLGEHGGNFSAKSYRPRREREGE